MEHATGALDCPPLHRQKAEAPRWLLALRRLGHAWHAVSQVAVRIHYDEPWRSDRNA